MVNEHESLADPAARPGDRGAAEYMRDGNGVVLHPAEVLDRRAREATDLSDARDVASEMAAVMRVAGGIGLAAPQIGISSQIAVIEARLLGRTEPLVLVNPAITWRSSSVSLLDEGCLSLPGLRVRVARPRRIEVSFVDLDGEPLSLLADGLPAKCIQHEVDHLDGRLVIDLVPERERARLLEGYLPKPPEGQYPAP